MALLGFGADERNAVELLRKDHEKVKMLFREFEAAEGGGAKRRIMQEATRELELHMAAEEAVFYPAVREDAPRAGRKLNESLEEHHVAKLLIKELRAMSGTEERFEAKFRVFMENVKHHIKEEEAELFSKARTGDLDLADLGARLETAKSSFHERRRSASRRTKGSAPAAQRRSPNTGRSPKGTGKTKKRRTA
jgi:hemerythrin superfamily protein